MRHFEKIFVLLSIFFTPSFTADANTFAGEHPPLGVYIVRIWDIGQDVLGEPTWTGHVILRQDGYDTYTGDWVEYNDHFSAFYSPATKLLSGAWYSERDHLWGGINFLWNGVQFTGRWTWFGRRGTGYEIWIPVGADYHIPPSAVPPAIAPEEAM